MSAPRTKPWEVASGTSAASASGTDTSAPLTQQLSDSIESIPDRPASLTDPSMSQYGSSYGTGATSGYGTGYGSRYGGMGSSMYGSGGYGSSMYGGYGSNMYGGYGGYGSSMYGGGFGSSMYGSGMYGGGMGMYGQGMGGPGGLGEGTQATFQLIESIIGAVGGFAQMLEATYMATHSSFFTMVSLAEQFGNLKNALGSLLGIFALIKFAKKIFYKITGRTFDHGISAKEFSKFESKQLKLEDSLRRQQNGLSKPRISLKPLLLFLAASIGFPYLLSKAIQKLNQQQQAQQQRRLQDQHNVAPGSAPFDPESLEFAKALYEFNPENPNIEIELKPKELVAILSKLDPLGNESKWWKVRSRSGKVGYVPLNYLSIIQRKSPLKQVEPAPPSPQQPNQFAASPENAEQLVEEFQKLH
ncbi:CIC11C00000000012 [Sungouiella intermedia]|uniref:Peroxisomal membrane protein PEX13 n=1 Tax=Sungouiella intermedia TaxID=45354 RepID=A0A1L0C2B6_9ASCO|nr:CIC11C00000000012 [[Candida] intermedia]